MLHRDYILELVNRFVEVLVRDFERIRAVGDTEAITEMEEAIAELVELEPVMLLSLAPESLATFVSLSPQADAVAPYLVWGLGRVAEALDAVGDGFTANLRRDQARAVADAMGIDAEALPDDVADRLADEGIDG